MMSELDPRVLRAFQRPDFYPHPVGELQHVQTHISHVFLTGELVYKLKKPVDFGFLDFSSLEKRRRYCLEELRLNRRLAPHVYRRVMAVVPAQEAPAGLELVELDHAAAAGALEYCLVMTQMDQTRMMDLLLEKGQVGEAQVAELAEVLVEFYAQAGRGPEVESFGRPEQIRFNVEENFTQTEDYQDVTVSPERWRAVRDYSLDFLEQRRELLLERVAQGCIVDGHGDLHSANINLPRGGRPIIYDCIEFNQRFRYQDLACDLAFLAMDLDFHGREDLARALIQRYVQKSGDATLGEVLDFYKCYRAVVRAKIHGFTFDDESVPAEQKYQDLVKARAYFRLAARYAGGEPPYFLVCVMGLMGTGKSYLARHLAAELGWPHLQSDRVRKQLAGIATSSRRHEDWGRGIYGQDFSRRTYQALYRGAEARLAQGASVIVDASFREDQWRRRFLDLAREHGAQALFLEVWARPEVVDRRLARREAKRGATSDGRRELLARQAAAWQDAGWLLPEHGLRVDGGAELEEKLRLVKARLSELGLES